MNFDKRILVTGGAGFIGSHVVRLFVNKYPNYRVVNFDALTYAGNLNNLTDVEQAINYSFLKGDVRDLEQLQAVFEAEGITDVIHLAAESHVDRSILDPLAFVKTNVLGTSNLLHTANKYWGTNNTGQNLFYHVSTDEVYGSLGKDGLFTETTPYDPKSPYSASKASSDMLVRSFGHTFNLPYVISNCSNNYGPNQFPEKLIPLFISNIINKKSLPVYGKGENVRDWLYVEDHAKAIDIIFHEGRNGETYNVGGENEWSNISLIMLICSIMDDRLGRTSGASEQLITFVKDRAGHDFRYAIDNSKLTSNLGWRPNETFESGLSKTVDWYLSNEEWVNDILSGAYATYYKEQYGNR